MNDLEKIRSDYAKKALTKKEVASEPIAQFEAWFNQVMDGQITEPTACTLSTASKTGKPSGRIVLLKGFDSQGFTFFMNYSSRKGSDLIENPYASLTFFWKELERQVRIEGIVQRTSDAENDRYFKSRPLGSQLGAWASPQSQAIPNREYLEKRMAEYAVQYAENVPRPEHWGGFVLDPDHIEFWQGRSNRLHDRILYTRKGSDWIIQRLAP
ncbi:MAG: pyridoxamine 5'-phosphate oxidase [Bacteroidetes bacterium]|nr:pyridoxamine 5'-phosphate oxidase [Bacteroidota bacterium]